MKKLRIAGVLLHHPFGRSWAISPSRARQIEDKIGMLIEPVLAANGLDIVAIQKPPAESAIQLAQQILLTPRIKPIDILRLQRRCSGSVTIRTGFKFAGPPALGSSISSTGFGFAVDSMRPKTTPRRTGGIGAALASQNHAPAAAARHRNDLANKLRPGFG